MKKNILALVFIILALVFIIIGFIGVWYSGSVKVSFFGNTMESNSDIYLTKIEGSSSMGGDTQKQSISISVAREQYDSSDMDTSFLDALDNAMIITVISLVFTIVALVLLAVSFVKSKLQKLAGIFAIIVFIFSFMAPIYFMFGFTSFVKAQMETFGTTGGLDDFGFWYSVNQGGSEISMGPGYAWYLMIIGAVFALITAILVFIKNKQPISDVMQQPQTPVIPVQ